MKIVGKVLGTKALTAKLNKMSGAIERARDLAVKESTLKLHSFAVKSIQNRSGGTPAIRYAPKRVVSVSRPGQSPNSDTGRLVQSIMFEFDEQSDRTIGYVGSNLKYAAWLEFGTLDMEARPWLAPALEKVNTMIGDIFSRRIDNAIKGFLK